MRLITALLIFGLVAQSALGLALWVKLEAVRQSAVAAERRASDAYYHAAAAHELSKQTPPTVEQLLEQGGVLSKSP
jgi:hypothetical protein